MRDAFVIAQLSDIHCGSPYFDAKLLESAVREVVALAPDLVVVGGDLTTEGYAHEFREAREHLAPLLTDDLRTVVIPGNHDSKNVGYLHYRDTFGHGEGAGKGDSVLHVSGGPSLSMQVVAIDSSKPDLAEGEVGRERYEWIRQQFAGDAEVRTFVLHHHLVPVPGTGRERNTVWDSGDVLALLHDVGVQLVLSGHKHVPHVWLLNGILIVNSGTVSSYRLRGYTRPSYNVIEVNRDTIRVTLKYPGAGERLAAELDRPSLRLDTSPDLAGMFSKATWRS
ncbi:MAG TPA: metallophosphoesterase [Acidimicrobiales bacterium]|nr:metallophosphoesterase [Acidimicrobiales bacterium]